MIESLWVVYRWNPNNKETTWVSHSKNTEILSESGLMLWFLACSGDLVSINSICTPLRGSGVHVYPSPSSLPRMRAGLRIFCKQKDLSRILNFSLILVSGANPSKIRIGKLWVRSLYPLVWVWDYGCNSAFELKESPESPYNPPKDTIFFEFWGLK